MAEPRETKRRFAPVPLETTFQTNRKPQQVGPTAELTPDASPVSETPPTRDFGGERRRFAPQLIETSRRAYRVGDLGPATKPTDKTDITPYTKNIYTVTKPRGRRRLDSINSDGPSLWTMPPTRRETEDPAVKSYLLELAAKEAERQIQEAALAAFPNSRAREGGVAHFYYRESSGSDESPEDRAPAADRTRDHASRTRRKSSNLGMNWWHKHMQDHAKQLGRDRGDVDDEAVVVTDDKDVNMVSDAELDGMEFNVPPDPMWTTSGKATPAQRRDSGEVAAARAAADAALGARNEDTVMRDAPPPATSKAPELPYPNTGLNKAAVTPAQNVGRPFGQFAYKPDAAQLAKASQLKSPPMLGKDIKFRRCPSPKLTKLEPNHPFFQDPDESENRDVSGKNGLWHGYCFDTGRDASGHLGPRMLATPAVPGSPAEPAELDSRSISEEPVSLFSTTGSSIDTTSSSAEYRLKSGSQAQGFQSLDERLRLEKAEADRNEKIANEFNDEFITQVYNYLSLGYPATACIFDEELAKVSHTTEANLRSRDEEQNAKGHMLEFEIGDTKEEDRCPRWRALKTYILEWARQHPNLDNLDPLAWGVRERRGSWAI